MLLLQEKRREKAASWQGVAPQRGPAQCPMAGSRSAVLQAPRQQQDAAAARATGLLLLRLHESPPGSCSSSCGPCRSQQCSSSS
jgi:hypothetical protein